MAYNGVSEYIKNCLDGATTVSLEDNGDGTWTLTVNANSVVVAKDFFDFGEGTIDDPAGWPQGGDVFTIVKDAAGDILGFTWRTVSYPLACCIQRVQFTGTDRYIRSQIAADGVAGYWTYIYLQTIDTYIIGVVSPDGVGHLVFNPPDIPKAIPGTAFADVENPLDTEVNAYVSGTDGVGQLYYYNRPSGSGTSDNPDYVWSHDGDASATRIESPEASDVPSATIGTHAAPYDPLSPPVSPQGTNIPGSPVVGSIHHTGYTNGYIIQWNFGAFLVWSGPTIIKNPLQATHEATFTGFSPNYTTADFEATQIQGEGTTTYAWTHTFDGGAPVAGGTTASESVALPDTWQKLEWSLTTTDGAGKTATTSGVVFVPAFLQDTIIVDPNGDDTVAATSFRTTGAGKLWDSKHPFRSVNAAVIAATAGDTLIVRQGVYTETASSDISGLRLLVENARIIGPSGSSTFVLNLLGGNSKSTIVGMGLSSIEGDAATAISSVGGILTDEILVKDISVDGFEATSLSRRRAVQIMGGTIRFENIEVNDGHVYIATDEDNTDVDFESKGSTYRAGFAHEIQDSGGIAAATVLHLARHRNDLFYAQSTYNHLSATDKAGALVIRHADSDGVNNTLEVQVDNSRAEALSGTNRAIVWGAVDGAGAGTAGNYHMYLRNFHGFSNHGSASTLTEAAVIWELSGDVVVNKAESATTTTATTEGTWDASALRTK